MSTLKTELQKVHRLPLIKRVWLYVKDHSEISASAVGSALKEKASQVSSVLGQLHQRGMATRQRATRRDNKKEYVYSIPNKFTEYELLPMPKKPKPPALSAASSAETVEAESPVLVDEKSNRNIIDLDNVTISQARQLYAVLHKMFGHEKR